MCVLSIVRKPSWFTRNRDVLITLFGLIFNLAVFLFNEDFTKPKYDGWIVWSITLLKWLQVNASVILMVISGIIIIVLLFIFPLVRKLFERDYEDWEWLRFFVERASEKAYEEIEDREPHYDRVTLFKYVRRLPRKYRHWSAPDLRSWRLFNGLGVGSTLNYFNRGGHYGGRGGWLIPVIRSRHEDVDCLKGSVFAVPKGDMAAYEGVGGQAFRRSLTEVIVKLPRAISSTNVVNRQKYATKCKCPIELVNAMIDSRSSLDVPLPRTVGAIPIHYANGNKWGVLVFDSRNEDAFPGEVNNAALLNDLFETTINGMVKALGDKQ